MIFSYQNRPGCPLDATIATSASSYLSDDGRRGEIERIPPGVVKQNRMLFTGSRPASVSPHEHAGKMNLSRRTSEPFVCDNNPPMPRGMPTSSYLLRKSQENLLAKRLEEDQNPQDQTYRTIIMFDDRSRCRRANFNAKVHNSPRSRSVGVAENFAVARPALSVSPEFASTIPRSSEFLEIITQKSDGVPLSPNTIRRNCKQMMEFVKSRGCSLSPDEEGYESQGPDTCKDSATNEEMISMTDALNNSQLLLTELQKPKNAYSSDGSQGSSSPSGSVISDVEFAKLKEDEIKRLEIELGNAQECNQQLMSQMGTLARKNTVELKKALKDKAAECDALKRKVEKADKDRILWDNQKRFLESKQPMDIQQLQNQKRELAIQLDREQSEKQELFMQINTLIAENADIKCNNSGKAFESENKKLKDELSQLTCEKLELTAKLANAESELKHRSADVESTRDELARVRTAHELEKTKLRNEISECQKEIEMKGAALQSLRLAKQEPDSEELNKLKEENALLEATVSTLTTQLAESDAEYKKAIAKLKGELETAIEEVETAKRSARALEDAVAKKEEELEVLRKRVAVLEENQRENDGERDSLREEVEHLKGRNRAVSDQLDAVGKQFFESKKSQDDLEQKLKSVEEKFKAEREELERRFSDCGAKDDEKDSTIIDLRREIVKCDKEKTEVENTLKNAQKEKEELKKEKSELDKTISENAEKTAELLKTNEMLNDYLTDIKQARERLGGHYVELENQYKDSLKENEELKKEKSELDKTISENAEKTAELLKTNEMLNDDIKILEEMRGRLEEDYKKLQQEKMALEKHIHVTSDSAAAERSRASSEIETHVSRVLSLEAQLDSQKDSVDVQVKQLRAELTAAGEKHSELTKELEDSKSKIMKIETEKLFALEEATATLKETESVWAEKLMASAAQTSRKTSEVEEHEKTIERLKLDAKEKANALQNASEENESLQHEIEKLNAANKDFEKELQTEVVTLATSLQSVRDENATQQNEITNLRKRISDLQDELHKMESQRNDTISVANGTLEAELAALKSDIKTQKESSDALIGVIEAEKKIVDEEVRYLKSQLDSLNEDSKYAVEEATKKLAQQVESLRRNNEKLANEGAIYSSLMEEKQARLTDAETRLTVQGEAIAKLETALQQSHSKLSETERKLKTVEENEDGTEELESELMEMREKLSEAEGSIVDLNTQLHNSDRAKQELEKATKESSGEVESLKMKLKEIVESTTSKVEFESVKGEKQSLEKKNLELEKELQKVRDDLISNVNRFTEHLQMERERSDSDRKKSVDELAALQAQLVALQATKTDFENTKAAATEMKRKVEELERENRELRERPADSDPQRVAELVEENARLAGDLLKEQNRTARNNSSQVNELKREYEDELQKLGRKQSLQEEVLRKEISDLKKSIESDGALVRRKITTLETEREKLEEELGDAKRKLEKTHQNGNSPVPPPRRMVSSNSTVSTDTFMSERSMTPSNLSEIDDCKRLRAELEKSHRLVSVLRRKLQQATSAR